MKKGEGILSVLIFIFLIGIADAIPQAINVLEVWQ